MNNRNTINLVIDAILLLAMSLIAGIGFLIKYVLLSGRDENLDGNVQLFLFGLDRHQWGTVHLVVGFVFLALLGLHLVLHWNMIKAFMRKALPSVPTRWAVGVGVGLAALVLMLAPFRLEPEEGQRERRYRNLSSGAGSRDRMARGPDGRLHQNRNTDADRQADEGQGRQGRDSEERIRLHRNINPARSGSGQDRPARDSAERVRRYRNITSPPSAEAGPDHQAQEALNGRNTLAEAADYLGVPVAEVKARLGLSAEVPDDQTLGRLRRSLDLCMEDFLAKLGIDHVDHDHGEGESRP